MKYQIELLTENYRTPIDTVEAEEGYTAKQYIFDCIENADIDWIEMVCHGTVIVVTIE